MACLDLEFTPHFKRDYKLVSHERDMTPLWEVMHLIRRNDHTAHDELTRRHNMHRLKGR